jgi:hypothetical protein
MAHFLVFCEARADFEIVAALVDRLLQDEGPPWLRDLFEDHPDLVQEVRSWMADEDRPFFDLHQVKHCAPRLGVRVPHGHFDGRPGNSGALMARTAFLVAREIARRGASLDAVLLVWDMDDEGQARRAGLNQAREEALRVVSFKIVLGCPDPMREAWVLAGFDPATDQERARLEDERRELGFSPCEHAQRLTATNEQARRHPKRVLHALTGGARDREARCWTAAPLEKLRARGHSTGLRAFLDEVAQTVLPLVCRPVPAQAPRDSV